VNVRSVLFDFSGTLFHFEPDLDSQPVDRAQIIDTVTSPDAALGLSPELLELWEQRDLDRAVHRTVYLAALRAAHPSAPDALLTEVYELVAEPASWSPYPDTIAALRGLHELGIPVGVVSNIPWDVQDVFRLTGVDDYVAEYVLSFVEGVIKPDPKIFLTACERLGVSPDETLMIGDNRTADGGATAIGCAFAEVARVPPAQRPDALVGALATHGVWPTRTISG
jgi:HAD superfamily hydrolase (TIGR01493 family)